jgi:hypothetical protein
MNPNPTGTTHKGLRPAPGLGILYHPLLGHSLRKVKHGSQLSLLTRTGVYDGGGELGKRGYFWLGVGPLDDKATKSLLTYGSALKGLP